MKGVFFEEEIGSEELSEMGAEAVGRRLLGEVEDAGLDEVRRLLISRSPRSLTQDISQTSQRIFNC